MALLHEMIDTLLVHNVIGSCLFRGRAKLIIKSIVCHIVSQKAFYAILVTAQTYIKTIWNMCTRSITEYTLKVRFIVCVMCVFASKLTSCIIVDQKSGTDAWAWLSLGGVESWDCWNSCTSWARGWRTVWHSCGRGTTRRQKQTLRPRTQNQK